MVVGSIPSYIGPEILFLNIKTSLYTSVKGLSTKLANSIHDSVISNDFGWETKQMELNIVKGVEEHT